MKIVRVPSRVAEWKNKWIADLLFRIIPKHNAKEITIAHSRRYENRNAITEKLQEILRET